jgi:hypothetical protein
MTKKNSSLEVFKKMTNKSLANNGNYNTKAKIAPKSSRANTRRSQ